MSNKSDKAFKRAVAASPIAAVATYLGCSGLILLIKGSLLVAAVLVVVMTLRWLGVRPQHLSRVMHMLTHNARMSEHYTIRRSQRDSHARTGPFPRASKRKPLATRDSTNRRRSCVTHDIS